MTWRASKVCTIEEITAFYVRFRDEKLGAPFTEMLDDLHISYDDGYDRPKAVVWPSDR